MSDIKKWMKIVESVGPTLSDQTPNNRRFSANDTVTVNPNVGGGVGRFVKYTGNGAVVDIKGVLRELAETDFSELVRGANTGNDWFHNSEQPDTVGTMDDKPEFRAGNLVQIADVYGAVIGPGFGVFIAYSTDGRDCIVSFDGKEILVPTANVGSVLEQDAKDNFNDMDNDGNLSPMSLGSQNIKIEEPVMDQKDEFSKWMSAVEEALTTEKSVVDEELLEQGACGGCGAWDCPECFPDEQGELAGLGGQAIPATIIIGAPQPQGQSQGMQQPQGVGMAGTHPVDGDTFDHDEDDEVDVTMMGSGQGDEFAFDEEDNQMQMDTEQDKTPRSGSGVKLGHIVQKFIKKNDAGMDSPMTYGEDNLDEAEPKPTKPKFDFNLDDMDDVLNPRDSYPMSAPSNNDGEFNDTMPDPAAAPSMPRASAASTRAKTGSMNPSELMRDFMGRIDPSAGGDEPELANEPVDQDNALVARSAADVPAVLSSAMQASGMQTPEWHTVNNLPGFRQQNVRGMGRQVFGMFTSTPLEQIQTIANVDGQGPNTDAEIRAVAGWLRDNADDLGEVQLDHGRAIPGYKPDVREFSANGVRFHVVRDPMGQYIYAYPDADARTQNGNDQLGNSGSVPRLNESVKSTFSLFEQLKLDEELLEAFIEESSLSKLIGAQKGGQRLVRWLHSKHKLGNDADLVPAPFTERLLWKEYKRNPDNFIIVSATDGVAGIKPYEKQIKDRTAAAAKKGKTYDPGGDSTLQYQIIAFTSDGTQVDPALLQPKPEAGEEREEDPTVMKARMGKISGKDTQNSDNVFNLLADQIGSLRTVYVVSGGVERDKIAGRAELNKPAEAMPEEDAIKAVFNKIRPVLQKLAITAKSNLLRSKKRASDGENFEAEQIINGKLIKLKSFLTSLDTQGDISIAKSYGSGFGNQIRKALADASGSSVGSDKYKKFLNSAAKGNVAALRPVLDSLRDNLVNLQE